MAAEGYILEIPESVLSALTRADDKIKDLAESSKKTQRIVTQAFKDMANGVNPFIDSLKTAKRKMGGIFSQSSSTDANRLSSNITKIATSLNKVSDSPVQNVNTKISSLKDMLVGAEGAAKKLDAEIQGLLTNGGGGKTISSETVRKGIIGKNAAFNIENEIAALEREKQSIKTSNAAWQEYLDTINGVSLSSQRQSIEMEKLNQQYRTGDSLLQQRQKMMDDAFKKAADTYEAEMKAAEKEEKALARKIAKEEKLAKKKEELANNKAQSAADREATKAESAYNRAMMATEGTITQRINKIAKLRHAEQMLTQTGRDYSTYLTNITSETSRLNSENVKAKQTLDQVKKSQRSVLNTSDQLQRKLALLFSVSAVTGYFSQLINVRKEFELQQRSLQAIIQNKDAANKVWEKTVQLAVKSPFTVKELVTYTKQLAAYRIETEKLYETNKMLADVSAGLGVDMNRLILAFGQVKAANYLRGTELRQFSEAGVNILGELATYFSEIEDRAISVGEVFEMVSKRMVSFGDVEEVFKRITSAGGIFYNMQEIQAETLQGQMSNLGDTIDLMFNDIGKQQDSVLKSGVALLRSMAEHWREISNVIVPIIGAYGLYKTVIISINAIDKAATAFRAIFNAELRKELFLRRANITATKAATGAQVGFNAAAAANPYILAASLIIGAISAIYMYISRANKAQKEFNITVAEGQNRAYELASRFKELAGTVLDSTKSYSEQNEALKELKRSYRDILPAQSLTIDGLKSMKGNYDSVTEAIYAKINAQTQERLMENVNNNEGKALDESTLELQNWLDRIGFTAKEAGLIIARFREGVQKGEIIDKNAAQRLLDIADGVRKIESFEFSGTQSRLGSIWVGASKDYFNDLVNYQNKLKSIKELDISPNEGYKISPLWGDFNAELDKVTKKINQWKKANEGNLNPFELDKQSREMAVRSYEELSNQIRDNMKKGLYNDKDLQIVNKFLQDLQTKVNEVNGSPLTQKSRSILEEVFKANNAPLDKALQFIKTDEKTWETIAGEVKDKIDFLKRTQAEYAKDPGLTTYTEEEIEVQKRYLKALEDYYQRIHVEIDKGTGDSEANKKLKEKISLLKEVGKEYEKNLELYGKEEALAKTRQDYAPAFDAAGFEQGFLVSMDLDAAGIISGLEKLFETASEEGKALLQRAISGLKGDLEIRIRTENLENTKKEIESLFTNYELTVELDKLGLDKNIMGQLFDIDTFSIDDIKRKLESMYPDLSKLSQEQLKIYKEASKKIADMEKKELEQRLKDYAQYLKKSMSERVAIELEGRKKIEEIPDNFTEPQKEQIKQNITKETKQKLDTQMWNDFKNTDLYISMFEDLGFVSTKALDMMRDKLLSLRNSLKDLDPQQLAEVQQRFEKINDEITSRNPFKNFGENISRLKDDLKELSKLEEKAVSSQNEYEAQQNLVDNLQEKVALQEKNHAALIKSGNATGKEIIDSSIILSSLQKQLKEEIKILAAKKNISEEDAKALVNQRATVSETMSSINKIGSQGTQLVNSMSQLTDMLSNWGIEFGDEFNGVLDGVGQIMGGLEQIDITKPMSLITGAIGVVSGIGNAFASVFGFGNKDKKKEKQIQAVINKVEKLGKAYEKLEEQMEAAYSFDDLSAASKGMQKNLEQQNEQLRQAIAAERGKKKVDNARIQEWLDTIEENNKKIEEIKKQAIEDAGGFGTQANIKSAAEEFASAWLDAYNETGQGLDGLNDKFQDWMNNLMKQQLTLKIFQRTMGSFMKAFDDALLDSSENGMELSKREKENLERLFKVGSEAFDKQAQEMMDMLGIKPTGDKNAELSGLQQGIQQITEETGQALESILNSMRMYVADSNLELKSIKFLLGGDIEGNPMLAELRMQTQIVKSLNSLLSSVVRPGHQNGGFGLNVFI